MCVCACVCVCVSLWVSVYERARVIYLRALLQDCKEQSGGEGEACAPAAAGAAATRPATESAATAATVPVAGAARHGWLGVGDSTRASDGRRPSHRDRPQRLQHQRHPRHSGPPPRPQRQQHQEEACRRRSVYSET